MKLADLPPLDQAFTHIDSDKTQRTFAVGALRRVCDKAAPVELVGLTHKEAAMIRANRGLEQARLDAARARDDYEPLLFCHMPDDTWLLVDGSHTYVAMVEKRRSVSSCYLVPQHIWEQFLIEDVPQVTESYLATADSGYTMLKRLGLI
jgi:hypothetical protein